MLRFLSSLFTPTAAGDAGPDRALIDAAIERAVDATDRRVRALGDYRQRLREPVARAVDHVIALVDSMPPPTEISAQSFGTDPRIRAFFSSVDHLHDVLGKLKDVREYRRHCAEIPADEIFGLLVMQKEERTVLGMELEGDTVRKDVVQVAVSFSHHRYIAPAPSEEGARRELKKRAFDFLIERALERLARETRKRVELEHQRRLLRRKLDALRAGGWGISSALADDGLDGGGIEAAEAEIESIDAELGQVGTNALGLDQSLDCIAEVLGQPGKWLDIRPVVLRLDYRGIKLADFEPSLAGELQLTELFSATGARRIILPGRIPKGEIPDRPDVVKELSRYLG
ncbi:hypothetical protein MCA2285 [Methylococcus capsulatus str. Bath]|uniref:Uncharacterized protein n=1 Tax=Methylococcus capsulatus (strain ATCC 33009 / NCIMB 11132 / Bath) TaxID=243233 RepID=Q605J7_METCA|nr:hypothetical protein [Methylococcus capsulatus]AAU91692.1 hypothetical protein MCA2285 [Methylococcus capsulatus str. Bath]